MTKCDCNNEYILKLAKNNKGIEQNKTEIDISKSNKYNDIIANILEYDTNGIYLIQEKADVLLSDVKFTKITGKLKILINSRTRAIFFLKLTKV